jgi:hypothetical protein
MNSGPLSSQVFRSPTPVGQRIENLDDAEARKDICTSLARSSPAERVHDVERPEPPSGDQPILDEIHGPR